MRVVNVAAMSQEERPEPSDNTPWSKMSDEKQKTEYIAAKQLNPDGESFDAFAVRQQRYEAEPRGEADDT